MAKRQSALAANYHRGLHGRPGEPGVRLQEVPDLNLYQMSAWPETLGAVATTVAQAIGSSQAPRPGEVHLRGKGNRPSGRGAEMVAARCRTLATRRRDRGHARYLTLPYPGSSFRP